MVILEWTFFDHGTVTKQYRCTDAEVAKAIAQELIGHDVEWLEATRFTPMRPKGETFGAYSIKPDDSVAVYDSVEQFLANDRRSNG